MLFFAKQTFGTHTTKNSPAVEHHEDFELAEHNTHESHKSHEDLGVTEIQNDRELTQNLQKSDLQKPRYPNQGFRRER